MSLPRLWKRWRHRIAGFKRQRRLWKQTGQRGHARVAIAHGRAARKLRRLIARVRRLRAEPLDRVRITSTEAGRPHWGGAADLMGQLVAPFMQRRGLARGSGKRTPSHNAAIGGSPTSDHLTTNTLTFARDFPTFSGADDARALAAELGISGWSANSYTAYEIEVDGHRFRVQILWGAAIAHSDHIHVGIELVG